VGPKPEYDGDPIKIRVRASCPIIEDGQAGDGLKMSIKPSDTDAEEVDGWHVIEVGPAETIQFQCETEPYDAGWTVRFVPEVEPVETVQ
jgi:hypothetical protein